MPEEKMSPFNTSHCLDSTAYEAIKKADYDAEKKKVGDVIHIILKLCDLCGYSVEERIILRDTKTGRIWR